VRYIEINFELPPKTVSANTTANTQRKGDANTGWAKLSDTTLHFCL